MEFDSYIQGSVSKTAIQNELENFYPYYQTLDNVQKNKFIERTYQFIHSKKFVPRQNLFLSEHIVIIVSACAVQITFGLDEYLIAHFEYILLYPDIYPSPVTGKLHKGETNLGGFVCLSWKHVQTGVDNTNDNYNLGLHEWMHALRFNGFKGAECDYFFENYIHKWVACAMPEYNRLRNGRTSILRKYGAENINEFLSVCTEHFFESPEEFEKELPDLFKQTCILLNQKPGKTRTTVNVRTQLLNTDINKVYNHNDTPVYEIEASLVYTLLNFSMRFMYYGVAMIVLLLNNSAFLNFIAALITLGAIVFLNNRYLNISFYSNYLYFQYGFFESFAQKTFLTYNQIIKITIVSSQFETFDNNEWEIYYFEGTSFQTKKVTLNTSHLQMKQMQELLQSKKIIFSTN